MIIQLQRVDGFGNEYSKPVQANLERGSIETALRNLAANNCDSNGTQKNIDRVLNAINSESVFPLLTLIGGEKNIFLKLTRLSQN